MYVDELRGPSWRHAMHVVSQIFCGSCSLDVRLEQDLGSRREAASIAMVFAAQMFHLVVDEQADRLEKSRLTE